MLIPNLLNARQVTIDRAAQTHAASVFKAATAYLAEDAARTTADPSIIGAFNCKAGASFDKYKVGNPGATVVKSCELDVINSTQIKVIVVSASSQLTVFTLQ